MKLKYLLTLFCLVFSISVTSAQKPIKVKKVTEKLMFSNAKYEVLKSDREIKHGFYKEYDFLYKKQIVSGNYNLGEKDGLWEERYQATEIQKNEGNFKKGQQVGVWKYYDYNGNLLHTYDYDLKTLLFSSECGNSKEYEVLMNGESIWTKLDCPPAMIGGIINLSIDITNTYFMSKRDNTNNIGGIYADISILIKKDGTIGNLRANQPLLNPDYIVILEDKINNSKGEWLSAELDGEKVDAYVIFKSIISSYNKSN